jgi:hypothetical protein
MNYFKLTKLALAIRLLFVDPRYVYWMDDAVYWMNGDEMFCQAVKETPRVIDDKDNSGCHTLEVPLIVKAAVARKLEVQFEFLRQLFNACLGEGFKRLDFMRNLLEYAKARAMPKTVNGKPNADRSAAFAAAREASCFSANSLSAYASLIKNEASWNDLVKDTGKPKVCVNEIKISLPNGSQTSVIDGLESVVSDLTDKLNKSKLVFSDLEDARKATNQVSKVSVSLKKKKKSKKNHLKLQVGISDLEKSKEFLDKVKKHLENAVEVPSTTVSAVLEVIRKLNKVIPGSEETADTFQVSVRSMKKSVVRLKRVLDDLPKPKRSKARICAHEAQQIARRVFQALNMYALGLRGKPRFKGKSRPLHSIEGQSPKSGIRWDTVTNCLIWGDLYLPAMLAPKGRDAWQTESLKAKTKYSRLIWRMINGKRRWFAQLIQEGPPPLKYKTVHGAIVGLDVGPSTIAVFSEKAVGLVVLAREVIQPWGYMRLIQRKMDRSRRATNPQCYNDDGTYKPGSKIEVRSKNYEKLRIELAECERVLRETRRCSHGRLANCILACGNVLHTEKLSYRSFQKNFGRSVKVRAPGLLMELLRRKAERTGGKLRELDTWSLKLSQYDHPTNTYTKKALSQRWHVLGDGTGIVQRDIYSAFLASCVTTSRGKDILHQRHACDRWRAAGSLLISAGWMK